MPGCLIPVGRIHTMRNTVGSFCLSVRRCQGGWGTRLGVWVVLCSLFPGVAMAQSPEAKGLEIAQEMDRRELGFGDTVADVQMVLTNAHGQQRTRALEIRTKEVPEADAGDKILLVFSQPRDIQGTALLTYTHIKRPDEQWLYLPALKRLKRISSANQSGSFVGSEFAYEDLTAPEVEKYTYRYLRDAPCAPLQCFVIERMPAYKNSGYTRQVVWIDQGEYRQQKSEFYDRKNALLKTLQFSNYQQYLGKFWRALTLRMENHQTRKSTQLVFRDYRFRTGLTEQDFTRTALRRTR